MFTFLMDHGKQTLPQILDVFSKFHIFWPEGTGSSPEKGQVVAACFAPWHRHWTAVITGRRWRHTVWRRRVDCSAKERRLPRRRRTCRPSAGGTAGGSSPGTRRTAARRRRPCRRLRPPWRRPRASGPHTRCRRRARGRRTRPVSCPNVDHLRRRTLVCSSCDGCRRRCRPSTC